MKKPTTPFDQLERNFRQVTARLPGEASVIAQRHFIGNFTRQGYYDSDGKLIQWKKRSIPEGGRARAILIQSGRLRRSIQPRPGVMTARVVADAPHARIHNRGGEIVITPRMRAFFYAMHKKTAGAYTSGRQNSLALYWLRLARAKGPLKIPARPFMTSNPVLLNEIRQHTFRQLQTIFK